MHASWRPRHWGKNCFTTAQISSSINFCQLIRFICSTQSWSLSNPLRRPRSEMAASAETASIVEVFSKSIFLIVRAKMVRMRLMQRPLQSNSGWKEMPTSGDIWRHRTNAKNNKIEMFTFIAFWINLIGQTEMYVMGKLLITNRCSSTWHGPLEGARYPKKILFEQLKILFSHTFVWWIFPVPELSYTVYGIIDRSLRVSVWGIIFIR